MGAVYPTTIVTFTTKEDKIDIVYADHINKPQLEIIAIQEELGVNVAGSLASLYDRLALLQDTDGSFAKGITYPTNPIDGQAFYKSDEDGLFIYNGSDWESVGSSLSSIVFQWAGYVCGTKGAKVGMYVQEGTGTPHVGGDVVDADISQIYLAAHTAATYFDVLDFKYRKLQGQNSVALWAEMWSGHGSSTNVALCRADIGGQFATAGVYSGNSVRQWAQGQSIDVSGFDVGSYYDGKIYIQINGGTWGMGLSGVNLIAF